MKTLKDLAGLYKTLAQAYMITGPWRPAYKTGNLYRQVGDYNSATQMIAEEQGKYTLSLTYAPPGATYGKYVENGTWKMEARPFAEYAANSTELAQSIDEFNKGKVEEVAKDALSRLSISLGKLGKRK